MTRTIEKTVYTFNELSDSAKEVARQWYREGDSDSDVSGTYEDAATIAALMGLDLNQRPVKLMNGSTRYDPAIYYSGFSSQGDGACFESRYEYKKGGLKAVKGYAPKDLELHRIARELQEVQARNFYKLTATTKHRGHYYHALCMDIDVCRDGDNASDSAEESVKEALRDFANWIYSQLESEYEWRNADAQVDESILANEYAFYESGKRYC